VGENVTRVKVGDRVVVCASSCFASFVIAKEGYAALIPENITFEQAASLMGIKLIFSYIINI
jgi:NADPH:quinone reductase-like Zn-dependent oxidoreductase